MDNRKDPGGWAGAGFTRLNEESARPPREETAGKDR